MAQPAPQPPLSPEHRLALEQQARYNRIVRNLAIGGCIACPLIMALPPRKLDLYTFTLGVGFYLSADHLCTTYTGRGLVQQLVPRSAVGMGDPMPTEQAKEMQRRIREERERGRRELGGGAGGEGKEEKSILGRLWMGDEGEGWKERRLEEERRALEEGKGYWDIMIEQIWDVWNWDKKKEGESKGGELSGEGSKKA